MTEYIKVSIELDEMWVFFPKEQRTDALSIFNTPPTMLIRKELFDEYQEARDKYLAIRDQMQQLWHIQEGKPCSSISVIPEHYLLKEKKDGA